MHIEHADQVIINLPAPRSSSPSLDLSFLFKERPGTAATGAPASTTSKTALPPAIGEVWEGHGGIYIGIARGYDGDAAGHLVMALAEPEGDVSWPEAGDWARTVVADGHTDFRLPTRFESALIYANARDKVDTGRWHWTGTQSSAGCAYYQDFSYGFQGDDDKGYKARARAVRRFPL